MGAYFALKLSNDDPEKVKAVVVYYGTGAEDFSRAKAAYLGHFAENDPYEPPENVEGTEKLLKLSGRPVTFYHYPGVGHWFSEIDRPEAYDEAAAQLAWERTVTFLKRWV
jgi:carboxymethylenebutenolidase